MLIESVEAIPVAVRRTEPMVSAGTDAPLEVSEFGIVKVHTSAGLTGIGEISMNPRQETGRVSGAEMCGVVNDVFGQVLEGRLAHEVRRCLMEMTKAQPGEEPAKSGVEMALWDVTGKSLGIPVFRLLGGKVRESVSLRWPIGFVSAGQGAEVAGEKVGEGYTCIKIKVGRTDASEDLAVAAAVRKAIGPDVALVADANGAFATLSEALTRIQELEKCGVDLIEQPMPRQSLSELAALKSKISTPILLDESMGAWHEAYELARAGAGDVLAVYLSEAGGMLAALNAFAIAEAAGMSGLLGSQCELGIGTAAMAHVGVVAPSLRHPSDATGHLRYPKDIIVEQLDYQNGNLYPPEGPGLGVSIDDAMLNRCRLDQ